MAGVFCNLHELIPNILTGRSKEIDHYWLAAGSGRWYY